MSDTRVAPARTDDDESPLRRTIGRKLLVLFIIGDILGAGIYALTGEVAGQVGGALWVPFVIAFVVAALTAASYAELVGKYPRAAGAALYTNRAFDIPFVTFTWRSPSCAQASPRRAPPPGRSAATTWRSSCRCPSSWSRSASSWRWRW